MEKKFSKKIIKKKVTKLCSEKKTYGATGPYWKKIYMEKNPYNKKLQNSLKGHGFVSGPVNLKYPGFRILVLEKKKSWVRYQDFKSWLCNFLSKYHKRLNKIKIDNITEEESTQLSRIKSA